MITRFPRQSRTWLSLAAALCATCALGGAGRADTLADRVDRILSDPAARSARISVLIRDLTAQQQLYAREPDELLIPASNMKVVTCATALDTLGGGYVFETILGIRGDDVVVIGSGDPGLGDPVLCEQRNEQVTSVLEQWASALQAAGVSRVNNIVIDATVFDEQRVHPSWNRADLHKWYAAPVAGVNFNDNCIDVLLWPTQPGRPVGYDLVPPMSFIEVTNDCLSGGKAGQIILTRELDSDQIILGGHCPTRLVEPIYVTVNDPAAFFGKCLKETLVNGGLAVTGQVTAARVREPDGALPADVQVIARHETPIFAALQRANKRSQNLFAEALLKAAGYAHARRRSAGSAVGSWETGASAVCAYLTKIGVPQTGYVAVDGSGLSRGNRLTARTIVTVLSHMHQHAGQALFWESLSVAGVDGTLERRLPDESLRGKIHGKSGYLTGASSVSGYADMADGHLAAFAILVNRYLPGTHWKIKQLQRAICREIVAAPQQPMTASMRR